ncbi:MAG: DNA-directed RNA polymerase subunit delta [Opitutus sp.]|nr:DNA-directed RNA polymerase subunit delta [Opitutus sp.]
MTNRGHVGRAWNEVFGRVTTGRRNPAQAVVALGLGLALLSARGQEHALVLQTDFGLKDGAVAAMRGVAVGVSPRIPIHDLSHENTPFDIWEAAYRLKQTAPYWPAGTIFVSVVDPGVGTARKSVVLKTKSGHLFVSPDNGSLTLVAEELGVAAVRQIDEAKNRRPGSGRSYTFHGRDVYAYVGARLAAGVIAFDDVGPLLPSAVVMLADERPRLEGQVLMGTIPYLDFQYGNVWTNLDEAVFGKLQPNVGDRFRVTIARKGRDIFAGEMPYARTFADVPAGSPVLYLNSLMNVAIALNQGDFATTHGVASGAEWSVRVEKVRR